MTDFLPDLTITGEQVRSARVMLRMGRREFAEMCHISTYLLGRMERTVGPISHDQAILKAIKHALENHGVELIEAGLYEGTGGPGIRMVTEPQMAENVVELAEVAETGKAKPLEDAG